MYFIYSKITNDIAWVGFTICTVYSALCPKTLDSLCFFLASSCFHRLACNTSRHPECWNWQLTSLFQTRRVLQSVESQTDKLAPSSSSLSWLDKVGRDSLFLLTAVKKHVLYYDINWEIIRKLGDSDCTWIRQKSSCYSKRRDNFSVSNQRFLRGTCIELCSTLISCIQSVIRQTQSEHTITIRTSVPTA